MGKTGSRQSGSQDKGFQKELIPCTLVQEVLLLNGDPQRCTSHNSFSFLSFTFTILFWTWQKNILFFINFIFNPRLVLKQAQYMTNLLSFVNTVLWCNRCKIHRYVATPFNKQGSILFFGSLIRIQMYNLMNNSRNFNVL